MPQLLSKPLTLKAFLGSMIKNEVGSFRTRRLRA